jgi:hypothetical protein
MKIANYNNSSKKNHDLLPGDQINPENPRRWLLIKREMPVPDPNNGIGRWSVDFFFTDQDAVPTFVECKRFADTRSRREVVGQMFEYAANGHYYWTKDMLQDYALQTATKRGQVFEEVICALQPTSCDSVSLFFEKVQENLREGQVRIVFFMEESPMELRSVVDFLNKQMERSEILLVEARQYQLNGSRVVVPTLFGYTEEARQVKRSVTVTTAESRKKWDKTSFFDDARQKVKAGDLKILESFYNKCLDMGFEFAWGTGKDNGSFSIRSYSIFRKSLLALLSNGNLTINLGELNGDEAVERARDRFKELVVQNVGLKVPDDYKRKYPSYRMSDWGGKAEKLAEVLKMLLEEFHDAST